MCLSLWGLLQCWSDRYEFHSPQIQLTQRRILPFRLSAGDLIHDYLGEYFTDPCKRNCCAKIWIDSTLSLKIIHWDLRYNAYQHPCDLMVKPFQWQPKEQRKMQHWEKCIQITWTFHNFCSKESSFCRQHIFLQFLFLTYWTHGNKVPRNIDKNANILIKGNAFENVVCKMTAILSRPHFSDYIWHFQWNQVKCHKASLMITQK